MGRNQVYTEITIRLFDQPSEFALRGRSTKAVVAALVRGAAAHGAWLHQVARWVEELSHDGWRYRGYTGDTLLFRSVKPLDEGEATAYVRRRLGQGALERVSVREACLLYTSPSPRDLSTSRMPSSA